MATNVTAKFLIGAVLSDIPGARSEFLDDSTSTLSISFMAFWVSLTFANIGILESAKSRNTLDGKLNPTSQDEILPIWISLILSTIMSTVLLLPHQFSHGNMIPTLFALLQPWVYPTFIVFCIFAFSGSVSAVLLHNKPKMDKFFRFCRFYSLCSMVSAVIILLYAVLSITFPSVVSFQQIRYTFLYSRAIVILLPAISLWSAFQFKHRRAHRVLLSLLTKALESPANAIKVVGN